MRAEIEGLKRKLTGNLSPTNPALQSPWDVSECAGMYWRPNFDTLFFPYLPTHVTKPKECKKLFVVPLADKGMFAVRGRRAEGREGVVWATGTQGGAATVAYAARFGWVRCSEGAGRT